MSVRTDQTNYVQMSTIPAVVGLSLQDQDLLDRCVRVWAQKHPRNMLRSSYDDMHQNVKGLQGLVPEQMLNDLDAVCGWPHIAVDKLKQRIMFDGLVSPSGNEDPFDLKLLLRANHFETEFPQAVASALIHSCAFISTTEGDTAAGEPEVVVMPHSALWSSAIWDRRRRQIAAAFTVNTVDSAARPTMVTLFTPASTLIIVKGAKWYLEREIPNRLGRVPVEALVFDPSLERPFGRSRISREVMALADRAMRTAFRGETAEALYAAMKIILLGAEESAFERPDGSKIPVWDWAMQRINALSRDSEGEVPEVKVVNGQSPEPYIATRRDLAAQFSGATNVPMSALGVMTDSGPSSADAIYAAKEDLVIQAADTTRVFGASLARVMQNVVMLRDGRGMDDELAGLSVKWRNPAMPSIVSQSDAMVKQISALPWIADTTVALEELGYSDEQITRLLSDKRRAQSSGVLDKILAGAPLATEVQAEP